ncbi:MAG: hypothetical protein AAF289_05650 [Cyanobacteria bacterium P01_A01_bin.135]
MSPILLIAALVISFFIFTWLTRVVRATISTAITIALIALALQLLFGIGPQDIWQQMVDIWQRLTDIG